MAVYDDNCVQQNINISDLMCRNDDRLTLV